MKDQVHPFFPKLFHALIRILQAPGEAWGLLEPSPRYGNYCPAQLQMQWRDGSAGQNILRAPCYRLTVYQLSRLSHHRGKLVPAKDMI